MFIFNAAFIGYILSICLLLLEYLWVVLLLIMHDDVTGCVIFMSNKIEYLKNFIVGKLKNIIMENN